MDLVYQKGPFNDGGVYQIWGASLGANLDQGPGGMQMLNWGGVGGWRNCHDLGW